jgi:hypothetical protein
VLSARAVPRSYKEDCWGNQVSSVRESEEKSQWQLVVSCELVCEEKAQEFAVGREPPFREDMSTEAEKYPLLEPLLGNY